MHSLFLLFCEFQCFEMHLLLTVGVFAFVGGWTRHQAGIKEDVLVAI